MKRSLPMLSLTVSTVLAFSTPSYAAEDATADGPEGASEANPSPDVPEILVTAQRREERLQDVPITITALSQNDLKKAGVQSVKDLGTLVSGFTFSGLGTVSQPAIRGVSTTISAAGSENPNAFYLDGVYQVSQRMLNAEQPDIDHIEVLKGPQGTLFGRNSTGGAIRIFTRDPSFTPHIDANIEVGAYTGAGTSRPAAHLNARAFATIPLVEDVLAVSVSGADTYTKGWYTEDRTGARTGLYKSQVVRGKILLTPSPDLRIVFSAYYNNNQNDAGLSQELVNGLSQVAGVPGVIFATQDWHRAYTNDVSTSAEQWGGYLNIELDTSVGALSSLTGYTRTLTRNVHSGLSGAACPQSFLTTFRCLETLSHFNNKETSQELNFSSKEFGPVSFITGLYFYNGESHTDNTVNNVLQSFVYIVKTKSYAGYGEVTLKPVDKLTLTAGVRYSHEKHDDVNMLVTGSRIKSSANSTTPRFTIRYAVVPSLNIYASYSKGYKTGLTGVTNQGNPVRPEKNTAYEGGLKFVSGGYTANISAFYYDYKNLQVQSLTNGINALIQNAAAAKFFGLDADVVIPVNSVFRLRGAVTWMPTAKYEGYTQASYTVPIRNASGAFLTSSAANSPLYPLNVSGDRVIRAPRWSGSATASYDDKVVDGSVTLAFSSALDHDLARVIHQNAYATLSATIGYRPGEGPLRIGLYGRNLTNVHYKTSGLSLSAAFLATYAPPMEAGISLGYTF